MNYEKYQKMYERHQLTTTEAKTIFNMVVDQHLKKEIHVEKEDGMVEILEFPQTDTKDIPQPTHRRRPTKTTGKK